MLGVTDFDLAFSTCIATGVFPTLPVRPLVTLNGISRHSGANRHHAIQSELVLMHHLIVFWAVSILRIRYGGNVHGLGKRQPAGAFGPVHNLGAQ